tara:strand:+ start:240 stop:467 length:228 start_codon:yes stop_codon:yes gene_type:complete
MPISKELFEQLIKDSESTLAPYQTADKIISEVKANGDDSKNRVVNILIEYAAEAIEGKAQFQKIMLEHLKSDKES